MIVGTLVLTLLFSLVSDALLTHLHVEAVSRALLATWVALATDRLSGERFKNIFVRRIHPLVIMPCEFYNQIFKYSLLRLKNEFQYAIICRALILLQKHDYNLRCETRVDALMRESRSKDHRTTYHPGTARSSANISLVRVRS